MIQRILVGYDGSEAATHALDRAIELAKACGASLTVLTAASDRLVREDGVVTMSADEDLGRRCAESGAARARESGVTADAQVSVEAPDDAIVLAAKEGSYDLVVVGHRGVGALEEFFLGSTAKSVVDRLECSVLVVR
ncbi:MAG: universal stress protein [Armatimonadota bacterium]